MRLDMQSARPIQYKQSKKRPFHSHYGADEKDVFVGSVFDDSPEGMSSLSFLVAMTGGKRCLLFVLPAFMDQITDSQSNNCQGTGHQKGFSVQ